MPTINATFKLNLTVTGELSPERLQRFKHRLKKLTYEMEDKVLAAALVTGVSYDNDEVLTLEHVGTITSEEATESVHDKFSNIIIAQQETINRLLERNISKVIAG